MSVPRSCKYCVHSYPVIKGGKVYYYCKIMDTLIEEKMAKEVADICEHFKPRNTLKYLKKIKGAKMR